MKHKNPAHCSTCGAPLPAADPEGSRAPCPRCLLSLGLGPAVRGLEDEPGPESAPEWVLTGGARPGSGLEQDALRAPLPVELAPFFPQLTIDTCIGSGGMGHVYRARHRGLDRAVALKVLGERYGKDPAFAQRFDREARALARLTHPNIVGVHDAGRAAGLCYLVMEFVDGTSLRELLSGPERVAPEQALAIVRQICAALEYAHTNGVVHRDIKPENVLIDRAGRVKIADFGLAKIVGSESTRGPALTRATQAMGTPQYMAPEQVERPLEVDHRADIYSLGVVFYELLTGELPLGRFDPLSRKSSCDVGLDEVVLKTLEKEPARRYQSAAEITTDVDLRANRRAARGDEPPASATRERADAARSWLGSALGALGVTVQIHDDGREPRGLAQIPGFTGITAGLGLESGAEDATPDEPADAADRELPTAVTFPLYAAGLLALFLGWEQLSGLPRLRFETSGGTPPFVQIAWVLVGTQLTFAALLTWPGKRDRLLGLIGGVGLLAVPLALTVPAVVLALLRLGWGAPGLGIESVAWGAWLPPMELLLVWNAIFLQAAWSTRDLPPSATRPLVDAHWLRTAVTVLLVFWMLDDELTPWEGSPGGRGWVLFGFAMMFLWRDSDE